jgi:hypothetical protein
LAADSISASPGFAFDLLSTELRVILAVDLLGADILAVSNYDTFILAVGHLNADILAVGHLDSDI